ncbi:MAG: diguanylate cyclase [Granulosicoccaceae bacterium]|jgi:two-component system cell cycle response regulator
MPARQTSIMVVDGSEVSRTIISRILKNELDNVRITACATAAEALSRLGNFERFDLITTSLMLPDLDGLDLCRKIRSSERHHYTPVIVVSGDADTRLLREGFAAGVTDYFDKSSGYKQFIEFIKSFLQRNSGLVGKILYVEDSPTAAAITRRIMEKHGLKVVHVTHAEQALELLEGVANGWVSEDEGFDIIVTDFFLKGKLTGGDLLHAIRTRFHYSQQEMPVLVITVTDNQKKQAEVFHAGANDFVTKPIYEEIFIARIRSLLLIKQQFIALKHQAEEMSRLATTDSLTGVRSKRYLLDHGNKFFRSAQNQPVTAMIMDIDFFKKINDELGHLTGDHVLAGLGEQLNQMFPDDMVVRFGGEEFSVIFANTDCERGRQLGEQLRQKVEQLCPAGVDITVSVGVASTSNHPQTDLTGLLAHADKALYAAKERGRNRVCIATDNGPQDAVAASA